MGTEEADVEDRLPELFPDSARKACKCARKMLVGSEFSSVHGRTVAWGGTGPDPLAGREAAGARTEGIVVTMDTAVGRKAGTTAVRHSRTGRSTVARRAAGRALIRGAIA